MDITCSKCGTEYSLDDTLISTSGTSVRCMNCNQVFKVYKSDGRGPDEWLLRQAHGPFRTIDNLSLLQQWIHEGKISPDDLLSRRNGHWKKVGDIEQLKPFFTEAKQHSSPSEGKPKSEKSSLESTIKRKARTHEVDTTERFTTERKAAVGRITPKPASPSREAPPVGPATVENDKPTLPPPPITADVPLPAEHEDDNEVTRTFSKPEQVAAEGPTADSPVELQVSAAGPTSDAADFSSIPASHESTVWETGEKAAVDEPAWTGKAVGLPRYESTMESMSPAHRKGGKWYIPVAAIIGLGVAALFLFWPEQQENLLSTVGNMVASPEQERYKKFFDRGQENFLLDTDTSFLQADREFQKVLALKEGDPPTLAALARLYAVWAQYDRDAMLDAEADASRGKGHTAKSAAAAEVEILRKAFDEKLREADRWSRQAVAADPNLKEAILADADTLRLKGDLVGASEKLRRASAMGTDAETEYTSVLIELDRGGDLKQAADRLDKVVAGTSMLRGLYRTARIRAAAGQETEADALLGKLLALNSAHPQSQTLKERMAAHRPIVLYDKAATALAASQGSDAPAAPTPASPSTAGSESSKSASDNAAPQGISAMLKRAASFQNSGRPDAAYALYQTVLEREPSNLDALTGAAYCKLDNGDKGGALASFRRALAVRPRHGAALLGTAETYKSMGNKEQALKFYREFIAAHPSGKEAEMAKKNIARFEAELGAAATPQPARKDDRDEIVIDDSPKEEPSAVTVTSPAPSEPPAPEPGADDGAEEAPEPSKPTIIIMKKDDPSPLEE